MDIFEMLKAAGVELPADQKDSFNRDFRKTYKSEGEISKLTAKIETERDSWKQKAEDAEGTLKKFEGIDPEKIQGELADWKRKAEDAQKDYQAKLEERDFNDVLKTELDNMKFSSAAARKAIESDIKGKGLKLSNGKILGLTDLIGQMKEADASAFVDESQQKAQAGKAKFTAPLQNQTGGTGMTKDQIMAIKDRAERQNAIASNMHLFQGE